jgi:hypothetical protein
MNMHENQVLHLGRTVAEWRVVAGCLRNSSKLALTRKDRDQLEQMARDIEGHLPKLVAAQEVTQ